MSAEGAGSPGSFPRTVAVIGLGLIGGSLALRLRAAGCRVLGVDSDPAALDLARQRGAVDAGAVDAGAVDAGAVDMGAVDMGAVDAGAASAGAADFGPLAQTDLVIVATPLDQVVRVGLAAARRMRPGAVLTDTCSVKAPIVAAIHAGLPPAVRFVGGHPMAGTEGQGMAAADPAILEGRPFVFTPTARTDPEAVAAVQAMAAGIGMRPVLLDPVEHDELVAQVSHLPYLLSVALVRAATDDAKAIAGPAMEALARIARSPAEMWAEICRANREAILRALARYEAELTLLRRAVETGTIGEVLDRPSRGLPGATGGSRPEGEGAIP